MLDTGTIATQRFPLSGAALDAFCHRHRIQMMALFGSVLRDDFAADSDIDVLVAFEAGHRVGLIGLEKIALELGGILGRRVDLNTSGTLSREWRDDVLREARKIYEAGRRVRFSAPPLGLPLA